MKGLLAPIEPRPRSGEGPQRRLLRGYLHKTSNGLCGIKGYASLIAEVATESGSAVRWAQKIIREVERMEEIFRSVGDLAAGSSGPGPELPLERLLQSAIESAVAGKRSLWVDVAPLPEADLLLPAADLRLVLAEILANSAECGDPDTPLNVRISGLRQPGGRIALALQDDGPGMSPELLAQAADPFVTTKAGHLGIGLTRVETLLDMYGLAWVLSSEPGQGTSITLEVGTAA